MSIIYEALKKAEANDDSINPEDNSQEMATKSQNNPRKSPINKKIFSTSLVILIIAAAVLVLFDRVKQYIKNLPPAFKIAQNGQDPAQVKQQSLFKRLLYQRAVSAKAKPSGKYVLEGIIYDDKTPAAIVNGEVLKKDDRLGEFTVTKITETNVELTNPKDPASPKLTLSF